MTTPARRRLRPTRVALLAVVALLVLEIFVFRWVGGLIGAGPTVLLVLATSALGMGVIRHGGGRARESLIQALRQQRTPAREVADAIVVLVGGVLLLLPGFVTDLLGLVLVVPFTRPVTRSIVTSAISRRLIARVEVIGGTRRGDWRSNASSQSRLPRAGDDVIEGEVIEGEITDD